MIFFTSDVNINFDFYKITENKKDVSPYGRQKTEYPAFVLARLGAIARSKTPLAVFFEIIVHHYDWAQGQR